MLVQTEKVLRKSLSSPDEVRGLGNGQLELVKLNGIAIGRITLQPGWKWSRDLKPIVKTERCEVAHVQCILTGRLMIEMFDGTRTELVGGDAVLIPPGHDAWVVGDDPVTLIDFSGELPSHARPGPEQIAAVDFD